MKVPIVCQNCGKIKYLTPSVAKTQKCCSCKCANTGRKISIYTSNKLSQSRLGEKNWRWKGKTYQNSKGRWIIWINGIKYVRARYVALQCLGRELIKGEIVHHINEDPSDDRSENLYVFPNLSEHNKHHAWKITPILTSNLI